MLGQSYFSNKELQNNNIKTDIHEVLHKKEVNWAKIEDIYKNETFVSYQEEELEFSHPIFTENQQIIEKLMEEKEEEQ